MQDSRPACGRASNDSVDFCTPSGRLQSRGYGMSGTMLTCRRWKTSRGAVHLRVYSGSSPLPIQLARHESAFGWRPFSSRACVRKCGNLRTHYQRRQTLESCG